MNAVMCVGGPSGLRINTAPKAETVLGDDSLACRIGQHDWVCEIISGR